MISARFRLPLIVPVVLLIASLAGAQAPPTVPRTLDVPNGALVAPGKAPDLDVLATGDVIGFIDPCG